jgi:hypothetical protein
MVRRPPAAGILRRRASRIDPQPVPAAADGLDAGAHEGAAHVLDDRE